MHRWPGHLLKYGSCMRTSCLGCALTLLLAIGCCVPPIVEKAPKASIRIAPLEGTSWRYIDGRSKNPTDHKITFATNGQLLTTHPRDATPDNDEWVATTEGVVYMYNDRYATHVCTRITATTMTCLAHNVRNLRWSGRLERE